MLPKKEPVGVIIGRFQVPRLHEGHKHLIQSVLDRHSRVIIFLGLSPIKCTINNPLDFESRKKMILDEFPYVTVLYIKDTKHDEEWSNKLDEMIRDVINVDQDAILYGGRDSFIKHYTGKFPVKELQQDTFIRGTDVRIKVSSNIKDSEDFRCGVIWATQNRFPQAIPTVDIAIMNEDYSEILLGRKKDEFQYRFIGGFVQPGETWETAARREVLEETGLEIGDLKYVGSFVIDDWRFRKEVDKITTTLFICKRLYGRPTPGDDIHELRWFKINNLTRSEIVDEHHVLWDALVKYLETLKASREDVLYKCKSCGKSLKREEIIWWVGEIYCQECYEKLDDGEAKLEFRKEEQENEAIRLSN